MFQLPTISNTPTENNACFPSHTWETLFPAALFPVVSDNRFGKQHWKQKNIRPPNSFHVLFPMFPIPILKIVSKEKREAKCVYTHIYARKSLNPIGNGNRKQFMDERGDVTGVISLVIPPCYWLITILTIGNSIVIIKNPSAAAEIGCCYWCYRFPY